MNGLQPADPGELMYHDVSSLTRFDFFPDGSQQPHRTHAEEDSRAVCQPIEKISLGDETLAA